MLSFIYQVHLEYIMFHVLKETSFNVSLRFRTTASGHKWNARASRSFSRPQIFIMFFKSTRKSFCLRYNMKKRI